MTWSYLNWRSLSKSTVAVGDKTLNAFIYLHIKLGAHFWVCALVPGQLRKVESLYSTCFSLILDFLLTDLVNGWAGCSLEYVSRCHVLLENVIPATKMGDPMVRTHWRTSESPVSKNIGINLIWKCPESLELKILVYCWEGFLCNYSFTC